MKVNNRYLKLLVIISFVGSLIFLGYPYLFIANEGAQVDLGIVTLEASSTYQNENDYNEATETHIPKPPLTQQLAVYTDGMTTTEVCEDFGDIYYLRPVDGIDTLWLTSMHVTNKDLTGGYTLIPNMLDTFAFSNKGDKLIGACGDHSYNKNICLFEIEKNNACLSVKETATFEVPSICYFPKSRITVEDHVYFESFSWSPDGNRVAFICGPNGSNLHVCIMSLLGEVKCWEDTHEIFDLAWSPVSDQLAVNDRDERIYLVDPEGKEMTYLTQGSFPKWSPDGSRIAFVKPTQPNEEGLAFLGIAVIKIEDKEERWLFKPFEFEKHKEVYKSSGLFWMWFSCTEAGSYCQITWSPDQKYLAFTTNIVNVFTSWIVILEIETGEITILPEEICSGRCSAPAWMP